MKTVAGEMGVRRRRNSIAIHSLVSSPRNGNLGVRVHSYFFDMPMLKAHLSLLEKVRVVRWDVSVTGA